jgi:phosphatidylglycerophosphate synthase
MLSRPGIRPFTPLRAFWTPFGRRYRNADPFDRERAWTAATAITLLRAVLCSGLVVLAVARSSTSFMLIALVTNMVLDTLDGEVARRRRLETILGAQLDGAVDRLIVVLVVLTAVSVRDTAASALLGVIVCVQFAGVDHILSTQFLRFGLWSPDHFFVIDERVWSANWSPLAKLVSNVPILLFTVSEHSAWAALPVACAIIAVHARSYRRVRELARALPEHCYAVGPDAPDRLEHTRADSLDEATVVAVTTQAPQVDVLVAVAPLDRRQIARARSAARRSSPDPSTNQQRIRDRPSRS